MKISIVQPDLKWEDKKSNFRNLGELVRPLENKTDIVILPEMFTTGFSMNVAELAEKNNDRTLQWMSDLSKGGNFGICGSFIAEENGHFFNRFVFISPDSGPFIYDKRHLFSIGEESRFYTAGKTRLVFSFRGFRICPFICYDLRFPVWSRNRNEYDLAIYVANWPEARINVWNTLLSARAIENQCFVAGSNRTGDDNSGIHYSGLSRIINPRGDSIMTAGNEQQVISAEISLTELQDFRNKFNVLRDADEFEIMV